MIEESDRSLCLLIFKLFIINRLITVTIYLYPRNVYHASIIKKEHYMSITHRYITLHVFIKEYELIWYPFHLLILFW